MKKIALLLPLVALALSACNSDKTSTTPTVAAPYDATGNWQVTTTETNANTGAVDTGTLPLPLTVSMTNKATGDFSGAYPSASTGQLGVIVTGNTTSGKISILGDDNASGQPTYVDCEGSFNLATNSYYAAHCYPQGATAAEKAAYDAQGSFSITMKRQ